MQKKLAALFLCATMALSLLTGCGGSQKEVAADSETSDGVEAVVDGQTIRVKDTLYLGGEDMPSINYYGMSGLQTALVNNMTHAKLIAKDADTGELKPDLALSWTPDETNTVWTFQLRQGVKFHNGEEFTAEDVKFTWDYASVASEFVGRTWTADVKEARVIDPYTVEFELNNPGADFPSYCVQPILSKAAFEATDDQNAAGAIGAGPYVFGEYVSGVSISLDRFDDYYGEPAVTPHVVFKVCTDENAMEMALLSGDVDASRLTGAESLARFAENDDYAYFTKATGDGKYLGFNMDRVTDIRVRRAIAMAVNREEIVDAAYGGGTTGMVAYSFFSTSSEGYIEPEIPAYDVEAAKALLAEAGYADGLTLQFYYMTNDAVLAEVLQAQLKKIGVDAVMNERSGSGFSKVLAEEGKYDIYMNTNGDLGGVFGYWTSQIGPGLMLNRMNYTNPEMDRLYEEGKGADYETMLDCWAQMQQIFADDCAAVQISNTSQSVIGAKGFGGVKIGNSEQRIDYSHAYMELEG